MKYLLLLLLLVSSSVFAAPCTFTWTAPTTYEDGRALNPATDLLEYRLYIGSASGTYNAPISILPTETSYVADFTTDIYAVITAVDVNSIESVYSNEVYKPLTRPSGTTLQLQCTITM